MSSLCLRLLAVTVSAVITHLHAEAIIDVTAEMTPRQDVFVCFGGSFQLNCTVRGRWRSTATPGLANQTLPDPNSRLSVHSIFIRKINETVPRAQFTYHEEALTLQMNLDNVTREDMANYFCFYNNSFKAFKTVHVGEPPGKPEPPVCVSYSFLNMICYVKLSQPPDSFPWKWRMEFRTARIHRNISSDCKPVENSDVMKCDLPEDAFREGENYTITVIKTEGYQPETAMCSYSFEVSADFSIVKPGPVSSLDTDVLGSSSAVIKWEYPAELSSRITSHVLEFEVQLTADKGWDKRSLILMNEFSANLDDLACNAQYTVAVRCRPTVANLDIYWSEWSTKTFHTNKSVPEQSTNLSQGAYYVLETDRKSFLSVVLYWKNPQEQYSCGNITGYSIEVSRKDPPVQGSVESSTVQGLRVYYPLENLFRREGVYELRMFTENGIGKSKVSSEVQIHTSSGALRARVLWVSVEVSAGVPRVTWEVDPSLCDRVTMVTYYWCPQQLDRTMNSSYGLCKDWLDWLTVPVKAACSVDNAMWINRTQGLTNLRFAVAVTVDGVTGGMVWEKFRFKTYDAVPGEPKFQVSTVDQKSDQLVVKLLFNDYYNLEEGGRPDSFEIVYMKSDNSTDCKEVEENPVSRKEESRVNFYRPVTQVKGLEAGIIYAVCGRFANSFGLGRFAKPQMIETASSGTGISNTAIIPIVVVLGVLVLIGVMCIICKCRRKVKHYTVKQLTVDVPALPLSDKDFVSTKPDCDDKDSGRGTDSLGSSSAGTGVECGQDHVQEPENKENSPSLSQSRDKDASLLKSASFSSGLSGYLRVSKYGQVDSEDDLLSCSENEMGETNDTFSAKNEEDSRKLRVYTQIKLEDISLNKGSQESVCIEDNMTGGDQNVIDDKTKDEKEGENPKKARSEYVAAGSNEAVGTAAGTVEAEYTSQQVNAKVPDLHKPTLSYALPNAMSKDMVISTKKCREVSNTTAPTTHYPDDSDICGKNRNMPESSVCLSKTLDNGSKAEWETNNDDILQFETLENRQSPQNWRSSFTSNENTDIFCDMFDSGMEKSNYANPETLSLGQMSNLSAGTGISKEDSWSIKSGTSSDRTASVQLTMDTKADTAVLKMCNEINNKFDTFENTDNFNETKVKSKSSTKLGDTDTLKNVTDTDKSEKSQSTIESHGKVNPKVSPSSSGYASSQHNSSGQSLEVHAYVKAGVAGRAEGL